MQCAGGERATNATGQCHPREQGLVTLPVGPGTGQIVVTLLCFCVHGLDFSFSFPFPLEERERNYVLENARILPLFKWLCVPIVTSGAKVSDMEMT